MERTHHNELLALALMLPFGTERPWHGRHSAWQISEEVRTTIRDRKGGCRRQGL